MSNPKATLSQELGVSFSDGMRIVVLEDSADTVHLVLPPAQVNGQLSDADLNAVAGGYVMCTQVGGVRWNSF
jgi:hypothetical protein